MAVSVNEIIKLSQIDNSGENDEANGYTTFGGVLLSAKFAWLSKGPRLEIVDTKNGATVSVWTFGSVLKDFDTEIVCLDEIPQPNNRPPMLAVALDCALSGGMVCIYDFLSSRVVRTIQISEKITSLQVVDAGFDVFTLPGPLRNFDGIIAVGTAGGSVYLWDLCREICEEALTTYGLANIKDELNPCQVSDITLEDMNKIEIYKEAAIRNDQHLSIHLNIVLDKTTQHFTLKGPKGEHRLHVNKEEVTVSCLRYCQQLGSILVGYNFGAYQLYDLMNLKLVYTSPICEEHIPITHFALQEPSDDPRSFCYIWVVYSDIFRGLPLAVLYALNYNSREYHEGYGILYQDFQHANVRFQMELGNPLNNFVPRSGRILQLRSVNQEFVPKDSSVPHSIDDNLSLCILVWSVDDNRRNLETFACLFDLNQWYKAQMPSNFVRNCSGTYLEQFSIGDLLVNASNEPGNVLDFGLVENTLVLFTGNQKLEEHFCPNSISFQFCCLRENEVSFLKKSGIQEFLLTQIQSSGPLSVVNPEMVSKQIVEIGLTPLFSDLPRDVAQQREFILSTALENNLIGWLRKCASEWANGSFLSTGCSLDFFMSWAFRRATSLKVNCDEICTPLFDYSESRLDSNMKSLLQSGTKQLREISLLFAYILEKFSRFISNLELVHEQFVSLQTVSIYFKVLRWLLNVGLLPEGPLSSYPREDEVGRINAPYPAETLAEIYNHRRAILKIRNEELFGSSSSVLFIDNLIERECGGKILQEQWKSDGGNGLYPPPSLQSLLRTYLIENVNLFQKHLIVMYILLDLATILDQERYGSLITYLIKFPAVFSLNPGVIKLTQGFWQLDHGDFHAAKGLLLNPLIHEEDFKPWHHKVALRSFLLQNQHKSALTYLQIRKPIIQDDDDILTTISLYVSNNMLDEAFYFERQFSDENTRKKILQHLFNETRRSEIICSIIYRNLNPNEENTFLEYLKGARKPSFDDLLVYHHILRSHYVEAFDSHQRTTSTQIDSQGLVGQDCASSREKLIYSFKKLLPDVSKSLYDFCNSNRRHVVGNLFKQVSKPTPMSVFVHNSSENVKYKSTLIQAAMAKSRQTFTNNFGGFSEDFPFLKTPTTPKMTKRSKVVVVDSKVIEETSPSPPKKLKLSPRIKTSPSLTPAKLCTPIVKRRVPINFDIEEKFNSCTPHSILKSGNVSRETSKNRFEDDFCDFEKVDYTPVANNHQNRSETSLGLSPRKALARTPPVVRFEGLKHVQDLSQISEVTLEDSGNAKSASTTEDDVFLSLESTAESDTKKSDDEDKDKSILTSPIVTPKKRKSLKRSLDSSPSTPTRCSPRLSSVIVETPQSPQSEDSASNKSVTPTKVTVRSRRTLRQQVLENNTISRVFSTPSANDSTVDENESFDAESPGIFTKSLEKLIFSPVDDDDDDSTETIEDEQSEQEKVVNDDKVISTVDDKSAESEVTFESPKPRRLLRSLNTNASIITTVTSTERITSNESFASSYSDDLSHSSTMFSKSLNRMIFSSPESVETVEKEQVEVGKDSPRKQQKQQNQAEIDDVEMCELVYDDLSQSQTSERHLDPEMNVFEYSHDLSIGENITDVKEVDFSYGDLTYGQQDTLENVMGESGSTNQESPSVFETNITAQSETIQSPDVIIEVINEEIDQVDSKKIEEEKKDEPKQDDEVIEIGSSSSSNSSRDNIEENEDSERTSSSSSDENSSTASKNDRLDVGYEKNIYDSYESDESEYSYEGDDNRFGTTTRFNETRKSEGLFHGFIINVDVSQEEESSSTNSDSNSNRNTSSEEGEAKTTETGENQDESNYGSDEQEESEEDMENPKVDETNVPESRIDSQENLEELTVTHVDPEMEEAINNDDGDRKIDEKEESDEVMESPNDEQETVPESGIDRTEYQENIEELKVTHEDPENEEPIIDNNKESEVDSTEKTENPDESKVDKQESEGNEEIPSDVASVEEFVLEDSPSESSKISQKQEKIEIPQQVETSAPRRSSSRRTSLADPLITKNSLRKRAASVDTPSNVTSNVNEGASTSMALPAIEETPIVKPRKAKSAIEDYTMSRRLTRRQASLLQSSLSANANLEQLDPIVLLEKPEFDGNTDPDEQNVYEVSPTTSTASKPGRRLRSASQVSDVSSITPEKSGVKRKVRKISSEEASSPPKKICTDEVVASTRMTRSRSKSIGSETSEASNVSTISHGKQQKKKKAPKKVVKNLLPKIEEEGAPKKRTTRKKN